MRPDWSSLFLMEQRDWSSRVSAAVGRQVALHRTAQGLSLRAVAEELGRRGHEIDRSTLSKIEFGKRSVTVADLLALANVLNVAPVALMVELDEAAGPQPVEVANESFMPAFAFVEWWSGRLQSGVPGSDDRAWVSNMTSIADWQLWLRARVDANLCWDELRLIGAEARAKAQPIPPEVLQVKADEAVKAERAAEVALRRLPWGPGGPGSIDHVIHWLDRNGQSLGMMRAVLSRLSSDELEKALTARPVWGVPFGSLTGEAPPSEQGQ